jgi:hypothetical protein
MRPDRFLRDFKKGKPFADTWSELNVCCGIKSRIYSSPGRLTMNRAGRGAAKRDNGQGGLIHIARSPYWYVLWYDANGKQHKKSSGTTVKQDAQHQLAEHIRKARIGLQTTGDPSKIDYGYLRGLYIQSYKDESNRSLLQNKETGELYVCGLKHLDTFFGNEK